LDYCTEQYLLTNALDDERWRLAAEGYERVLPVADMKILVYREIDRNQQGLHVL